MYEGQGKDSVGAGPVLFGQNGISCHTLIDLTFLSGVVDGSKMERKFNRSTLSTDLTEGDCSLVLFGQIGISCQI